MLDCTTCVYYDYDETEELYYCSVDMDEDDLYQLYQGKFRECPYYRDGDEYKVVRKQM